MFANHPSDIARAVGEDGKLQIEVAPAACQSVPAFVPNAERRIMMTASSTGAPYASFTGRGKRAIRIYTHPWHAALFWRKNRADFLGSSYGGCREKRGVPARLAGR